MTKLLILFLVLSLALLSINCKDDEEDSVIPEKYVGTWVANSATQGSKIEYAPQADPDNGVDLTAIASVRATLNRDGSYSLTFVDPIDGESTDSGTISLNEQDKTILLNSNTDEDVPFVYEWIDDNTLQLQTLTEFDFTLSGNPEVPTIVTLILKRS